MSADAVWISSGGACVSPADRGFLLGDGVFDTLVAFNGVPFAAERHLARLLDQAAAIGIELDAEIVREGWRAVLGTATENVTLRTTVTRGVSGRGLWPAGTATPTIAVARSPWSPALFCRPVALVTSTTPRNEWSPASQLKSLGYLDNILAAREASSRGADDALFLNTSGVVACSTIANVFAIRGGDLVTPPLADGVQPGTMRAMVLAAAGEAGLNPIEGSLAAADLHSADAVFLTNSVRFLSPVRALDRALGGAADPLRLRILDSIAAAVLVECGVDPRRVSAQAAA